MNGQCKKLIASIRGTSKRKAVILAGLSAGLALAIGGGAQAISSLATGTDTDRRLYFSNDVAFTGASATEWSTLPGTALSIVVPPGESRMFVSRFNAESLCNGPATSYCSVRITYQQTAAPAGPLTEMSPAPGTEFAFDAPIPGTTTHYSSHSIERNTARLDEGTYQFKVQARRIGGATNFRLDDMNFAIEAVNP